MLKGDLAALQAAFEGPEGHRSVWPSPHHWAPSFPHAEEVEQEQPGDAVRMKGAPGSKGYEGKRCCPAPCASHGGAWLGAPHPGCTMLWLGVTGPSSSEGCTFPSSRLPPSPFPVVGILSICLAWLLIISHLRRFISIFQFSMQCSENKHVPD